MKSFTSHLRAYALSTVIALSLAAAAHAMSEETCARDPNRMNMVIQLTRTGQEKVSKMAYEAARRTMDESLKLLPAAPPPFGADLEACKRANISKLSRDEVDTKCFGLLPEALWNGNAPGVRLDRLEPVQMKMKNLKMRHLAIGKKPTVICQNNVCEINANIDQLDLGFDISARSVNENCDQISLSGVKINLDPHVSKKDPASVKIKFRYTENLARPIEVIWADSQIHAPVDTVIYQGKSVTQGANLCTKNRSIQKAAADLAGDLVAKNQFVLNLILDIIKTTVIQQFAEESITQVARANGLGQDKLVTAVLPDLKEIAGAGAMSGAAQDQIALAEMYTRDVKAATRAADIKKAQATHRLIPQIKDFMGSFKNSSAPISGELTQNVTNNWSSTAKALGEMAAKAQDPEMKALLEIDAQQLKLAVAHLQRFQRNLKIDLQPDDAEKIALVLTAVQANDLASEIQAKLSACYRCRTIGIPATSGAEWGFEKGSHDLAFKTGYGSVNQVFAIMQAGNHLDTCFIQGEKRDCKDARPDDSKTDVHFTNTPEMVWDADSNTFAFKVKKIQLTHQKNSLAKIARSMEADVTVPGKLEVINGGTSIRFVPVADKIRVSNPNFKAADWDPTKILSGAVAWAAERAMNMPVVQGKVRNGVASILTRDIDLPEGATLSQVRATPQGFGVYFNLPEDPTILLPPEKNGRALANNKGKLN